MGGCTAEFDFNNLSGYYRQVGAQIFNKSGPGSLESLMIGYDVGVGDTILGYLAYFRTVQKIDSILIGTEYHKMLYADTNMNEVYIEGIANLANYGFGNQGEFF
ncbi:MAG: hypothetical protein ACI9J3_003983 [Parvicellaceae bacterium]|jgi:hypothetical protein